MFGEERHRRLIRNDFVVRGVEHLKTETILLKAQMDDLGEVAGVDVAPGVAPA